MPPKLKTVIKLGNLIKKEHLLIKVECRFGRVVLIENLD
jgi:hypothetical protein